MQIERTFNLKRAVFAGVCVVASALWGCGEGGGRVSSSSQTTTNAASSTPSQSVTTGAAASRSATSGGGTAATTQAKDGGQVASENGQPAKGNGVKTDVAMFGGGCFWGVEHIFEKDVPGVIDAVSGFSGGHVKNPSYKQVCYEATGHVEVVRVTYDPAKVSYEQLVNFFYRMIDPTQVNGQGPDLGDQYRSVVFYYSDEQRRIAEKVKAERASKYKKAIAVVNEPAQEFYTAEEYHQNYYTVHHKEPNCHFLRPE